MSFSQYTEEALKFGQSLGFGKTEYQRTLFTMMRGAGLIRDLIDDELEYKPKRVISIVGPSRSGTTIFKHALCLHPDLCYLAGEEEPYYKICGEGYPFNHPQSDEFHKLKRVEAVRYNIANELHNHNSLQIRNVLQTYLIEEPPFVDAIHCNLTDTLVLKTPQNVYRRGVLEQLYPEAKVTYIKMYRDPRAVVNGLMDGWLSKDFTSHITTRGWWKFDMPPGWSWDWKTSYDIEDGDTVKPEFKNLSEDELKYFSYSYYQWLKATEFMEKDYKDAHSFCYENLITEHWRGWIRTIWNILDLDVAKGDPFLDRAELPVLMATDFPSKERWRDKRPWLAQIKELGGC